jgi:hypothetical protein
MIPDNLVQRPSARPIAYIKAQCPFSMRYVVALAELGALADFQLVRLDDDAPGAEAIRAHLAEGLGKGPSFPTVEWPDGSFQTDSGALIDRLCAERGVARAELVALELYERGVMAANGRMFQELRALRGA